MYENEAFSEDCELNPDQDHAADLTELKLEDLVPHERNREFFGTPSDIEIEELAEDMQSRGQDVPIEVVYTGEKHVIVKGHRRVAAALKNDWTTIKAKVRTDTDDPNLTTVIQELIKDNLIRGHCDDLALARCYRELKKTTGTYGSDGGLLRDRLADRLKCDVSGRTLERLEHLLDLPRDIQDLITAKKMTKSEGAKILKLDKQTQEKVFARLRKGHLVKFALQQEAVIESTNRYAPEETAHRLLRSIGRDIHFLQNRMAEADGLFLECEEYADSLEYYCGIINNWNDHVSELLNS